MQRLRGADRRRRIARHVWFALGGAAFALSLSWALAHSPIGTLHPALIVALTTAATIGGALAARSAPADDEMLARSVDHGSGLPQLALTVVRPLERAPTGLLAAVRGHTQSQLDTAAPERTTHRLPRLGIPRWPGIGAVAALLFFVLLPHPPDISPPSNAHSDPPHARPDPGEGSEDEGEGGGASAGKSGDRGGGDPQSPNAAGAPEDEPQESPQPETGAPQPQPTNAPPSRRSGDGSAELYGDPDRLDVNTEQMKVDSLFDEAIEGVKRTVMLPDPPKPTPTPTERTRARGVVPDEIKRADESALSERITDAAERDTVQRYFELLNDTTNAADAADATDKAKKK